MTYFLTIAQNWESEDTPGDGVLGLFATRDAAFKKLKSEFEIEHRDDLHLGDVFELSKVGNIIGWAEIKEMEVSE